MALRLDPFQTIKKAVFKTVELWRGLLMSDDTLEDMSSEIAAKIVDEETPEDHPFYPNWRLCQSFLVDIGNSTAKWIYMQPPEEWEEDGKTTLTFMVDNEKTKWITYRKSSGEIVNARVLLNQNEETLEVEIVDSEDDSKTYTATANYGWSDFINDFYLCDISPSGRYLLFAWLYYGELEGSVRVDLENGDLASTEHYWEYDSDDHLEYEIQSCRIDARDFDGADEGDSDEYNNARQTYSEIMPRWCILGEKGEVLVHKYEVSVENSLSLEMEWSRTGDVYYEDEDLEDIPDGALTADVSASVSGSGVSKSTVKVEERFNDELLRSYEATSKVSTDFDIETSAQQHRDSDCSQGYSYSIDVKTAKATQSYDQTDFDGKTESGQKEIEDIRVWRPETADPDGSCSLEAGGIQLEGSSSPDDWGSRNYLGIARIKTDPKETITNNIIESLIDYWTHVQKCVPSPAAEREIRISLEESGGGSEYLEEITRSYSPVTALRSGEEYWIDGTEFQIIDVPSIYPVPHRVTDDTGNDPYPVAYVGHINRDELGEDWPVSAWEGEE